MIHSTAIIDPKASLDSSVTVGPYCVIGSDVEIGAGTVLESHVVVKGPTTLGKNNHIFQFASVGEDPQDKKYHGEASRLEVGDNNEIRENCTIHRGTECGGMLTKIGSHNLLMASTHVAHDCILGNHIVMSNYAAVAGHVLVDDHVIISAYCAIHQFAKVGAHSFIARAAMVAKDVLPFTMVTGPDVRVCGLNTEGLKRRGFSSDEVNALKQAYKIIFRQGHSTEDAIAKLSEISKEHSVVNVMIKALQESERGIVR